MTTRTAIAKSATNPVPPVVHDVLASSGRPLDAGTRAYFEPRFGRDFSRVRIHDDARANESARAVNAHAYTAGEHIAFDSGKYAPATHSGRQLLAHELAHTVQQRGLQRAATDVAAPSGAEDRALEHEAERAASAVVAPQPTATPTLQQVGRPLLSRATKPGAAPEPADDDDSPKGAAVYGPLVNGFGSKAEVKRLTKAKCTGGSAPSPSLSANPTWDKLNLRGTKPGAGDYYIRGHLLNDNLGGPGDTWKNLTPLTSKANNRDSESHLHKFEKHVKDAVLNQDKTVEFSVEAVYGRPKQPLDASKLPNTTTDEKKTIEQIAEAEQLIPTRLKCSAIDVETDDPVNLKLRKSDKGKPAGQIAEVVEIDNHIDQSPTDYFLNTEKYKKYKQTAGSTALEDKGAKAAADTDAYEIKIAGKSVVFAVKKGTGDTDLSDQPGAKNVSGMILKTLHRKSKGPDIIDAAIEAAGSAKGGKKGLPVTIEDKQNIIPLEVNKDTRELSHKNKKAKIAIDYSPLSPGLISEVNYDATTGLSGVGKIMPSIPLLKGAELGITFSQDQLKATAAIPKEKLKALPGMRVTEAKLEFDLTDGFKPSGNINFEIGPEKKPLANGVIKVSADTQGFLAEGDLIAHIPGLDEAAGKVIYRKETGWTGGFDITKSGKDFIQSASVHVGFSDKEGLDLSGSVGMKLPGDQKVTVAIQKNPKKGKSSWIFIGDGEFKAPGGLLKPVLIHFSYDGEQLEGTGKTSVEFHGLNGTLTVNYRDGKLSGEGTLTVDKGKVSGKIKLRMSPQQKFSAEGEVTYKVSDNLITKAGLKIDENEKVTVKGALEFPKPIELFKPFKGDYDIFSVGISIPIPGASIGPIGVKARIEGGLSAGYHIGPGELRNVKIEAMANPLEAKPDVNLKMSGQLYIAAGAYVSGKVSGSIVLDAVIASASGGLTVTATASLDGRIASQIELHYAKGRFEVKADLDMMLALVMKLALDAFVKAEAGIGPFKVSTRKDWNLAAYTYDPGLKLGLKTKTPLYYASDQPFKAPSLDQIEITKPRFDVSDALKKTFQGAGGTEKPA